MDAELERRTLRTVVSPAALKEELAAIWARGYATDDEEYELGMCGVAAPIRDDSGVPVAAVGVTGPTRRLTKSRLAGLVRDVDAAAKAISGRLGDRSAGL